VIQKAFGSWQTGMALWTRGHKDPLSRSVQGQ